MTWRREQMMEDRHIRDAARALVDADFKNLRADLSIKGIGERAVDRIGEGASEVYDEAMAVAADHKGALAAIVAGLVLWFARHSILEALFGMEFDDGTADEG